MLETIRSYLVGLGFSVNDQEFNKVNSTLKDLDKTVSSTATQVAKQFSGAAEEAKKFVIAGTEVVTALTTIAAATGSLIKSTADADMGYQKFALSMWMTKDSAKDLQVTLKAMGESVEDIAWIPELRQQYFELLNLGNTIKTPGDAGDQLKYIRSIMFEFKKLKLEISYAAEWISYYLIKYLSVPLEKAKMALQGFNLSIVQQMPEWTNTVAKILSSIVMLAINTGRFLKDVFNGFIHIFDLMPRGMRIAIIALSGLALAIKTNPILLLLTTAILLIDDFYAYIDGRRSLPALAPVWAKIIEWSKTLSAKLEELKPKLQKIWDICILWMVAFKNKLLETWYVLKQLWNEFKQSETYKNLIEILKNWFQALKEEIKAVWEVLKDLFTDLGKSIENKGVVTQFKQTMEALSTTLLSVSKAIKDLMIQLHLLSKDSKTKTFFQWLTDELAREVKWTLLLVETLAHLISSLALAASGDKKGAIKELQAAGVSGRAAFRTKVGADDSTNGDRLQRKIAMQESTGNPQASNGDHFGKYQFDQGTWDEAVALAGRNDLSGIQPDNVSEADQDSVAAAYIADLRNQGYSDEQIAGVWYGGKGSLDWSPEARSKPQPGGNPSMDQYVAGVLGQTPATLASDAEYTQAVTPGNTGGSAWSGINVLSGSYTAPTTTNSSSTDSNLVTVDNINFTFGTPSVDPQTAGQAAIDGVSKAIGKDVALQTRDLTGVFG